MARTRGRGRLKRVVIIFGSVLAVLVGLLGGGFAWLWTGADISTVGKVDFSREMAVPPLAPSTVRKDGTRVFDLRMQSGSTAFKPGARTPTWGYNGSYLGPTLRAKRGEKVGVRVRNTLDEASTVHWHGMHLPAKMDGGPHQMVQPGGTWDPYWTVDQPAATLWYHPHPHGKTERQVSRGLAGMFILDDKKSERLPLPKKYGVDDLPVIVQDVNFEGAALDHSHKFLRNVGFLGGQTLVNGTLDPYRNVGDRLVRLRLLNASPARIYTFGFDDDRDFSLIGTDGGLVGKPAAMNRIQLSPGERAEVVVRMNPGEKTVLRSYPWQQGGAWEKRFNGGDDSFDILQLRAARTLRDSPALPKDMGKPALPDPKDAVRGRYFDLKRSGINGRKMSMSRIDEVVTRGATEVWTLHNGGDMTHNFHVHDTQFRVVSVNGKKPGPALRGPKDTIAMPLGATVKIAVRFDGPSDPDHPYMYHCHLLDHEDHGMMGQFVVVDKGQQAGHVTDHAAGHPGGHTGH